MSKIQFNHKADGVLQTIGFSDEEVQKLSDISWDKVMHPLIKKLDEVIPEVMKKFPPMEDEDGFNEEMNRVMPPYSKISEDIQEAWLEAGFEPDVKLGFMLMHSSDKVVETMQKKTEHVVMLGPLKEAAEAFKSKKERKEQVEEAKAEAEERDAKSES